MHRLVFEINTPDELETVAQTILEKFSDDRIFLLQGNLGAGKTTLVKNFVTWLGYHGHVSSPTFSIINEYAENNSVIYHIDLYRLESLEEAIDIGIEDYLYSENYCFIEWPDLIFPLIREKFILININTTGDFSRNIVCVSISNEK